jgi:hypothetical protein
MLAGISGILGILTPIASHLTAVPAYQIIDITFKYLCDRTWDYFHRDGNWD